MLTRNDPFTTLSRLQSDLARAFDDGVFGRAIDAPRAAWAPAVDVYEDEARILFKFELPEVRKEDLSVRVDRGVLTVEGARKLENEERKAGYHRVERSFGKFARSFALPDSVTGENIDAELKDGVLRVALAKKREAQARTIDVKIS
jgi:HSP20 family protein